MPADVRLTMLRSGTYAISSDGDDGSRAVIWVHPSGAITTEEIAADGGHRTTFQTMEKSGLVITGTAVRHRNGFDSTYDAVMRSELEGPWKAGPPIDKYMPDGGHYHIDRSADPTNHQWEHGSRTGSVDADGYEIPGRDWIRVFHPYGDAQHGGDPNVRESSEWGTKTRSNGDKINYSGTKTTTRSKDENGNDVERTVWTRGEYNPSTGEQSRGVTIDNPDGTRSTTWSSTSPDGSWTIVTITTDKNGDGTAHTSSGKGDETTTDSTEPIHVDPEGEENDPHDNEKTQPSGDGEGYGEGNPGGPTLDTVTMRHLLGDAWKGDDNDTLGDVEGQLRPYLDRIAAAAKASEHQDDAELLDTLGALPDLHFDLQGAAPDPTEELDGLGSPHPFFHTSLDVSVVTAAQAATTASIGAAITAVHHGAVPIETLQAVAQDVAVTVALVAAVHG